MINIQKKLIPLLWLILLLPSAKAAEEPELLPLMVQQHIFSPKPDTITEKEEKNEKKTTIEQKRLLKKIDRLLNFSGVIKTRASIKALIRNKSDRDETASVLYQEGDTVIDNYAIKEIHPNYIILAGKEDKVQINLFKDRSDRPAPQVIPEQKLGEDQNGAGESPTPQNPSGSSTSSQGQNTVPSSPTQKKSSSNTRTNTAGSSDNTSNDNKPTNPSENPFIKAIKDAAMKKSTHNNSKSGKNLNSGSTNPFLEAIKKARNQQN
ncbi:MAG: hypothetical protein R6U68_11175 [Desulfobacteraceae bacterium]